MAASQVYSLHSLLLEKLEALCLHRTRQKGLDGFTEEFYQALDVTKGGQWKNAQGDDQRHNVYTLIHNILQWFSDGGLTEPYNGEALPKGFTDGCYMLRSYLRLVLKNHSLPSTLTLLSKLYNACRMNVGSDELPLDEFFIENGLEEEVEAHWPGNCRSTLVIMMTPPTSASEPEEDASAEESPNKRQRTASESARAPDNNPSPDNASNAKILALEEEIQVLKERAKGFLTWTAGWNTQQEALIQERDNLKAQVDAFPDERNGLQQHYSQSLKIMEARYRTAEERLQHGLAGYQDLQAHHHALQVASAGDKKQMQYLKRQIVELKEKLVAQETQQTARDGLEATTQKRNEELEAEILQERMAFDSYREDMGGLIQKIEGAVSDARDRQKRG